MYAIIQKANGGLFLLYTRHNPGDEMLNRIKESLTRYFSADRSDFPEGFRDIESDYNQLPGEPYPTIAINDVGNANRMIEFYVTGKQYDVYHVAFKGFTKG